MHNFGGRVGIDISIPPPPPSPPPQNFPNSPIFFTKRLLIIKKKILMYINSFKYTYSIGFSIFFMNKKLAKFFKISANFEDTKLADDFRVVNKSPFFRTPLMQV